jgi:hypothetical protein
MQLLKDTAGEHNKGGLAMLQPVAATPGRMHDFIVKKKDDAWVTICSLPCTPSMPSTLLLRAEPGPTTKNMFNAKTILLLSMGCRSNGAAGATSWPCPHTKTRPTLHSTQLQPSHSHLSVKVHPHPQSKVQQRPLALRRLQLHTAHHLQPRTGRLLAILLLRRLLLLLLHAHVATVPLLTCRVVVVWAHEPNDGLLPVRQGKTRQMGRRVTDFGTHSW